MKKEWLKHYVLAFMFIGIIIMSVFVLIFRMGITGFATYTGGCGGTISTSGDWELSSSLTCNSGNGISITAVNVTLDCKGYSVKGPGGGGSIGIQTNSVNTTLVNCNITGFDYDIYLTGASSNASIVDSYIEASGTNDLYLDTNSINSFLINTTHDAGRDSVAAGTNFTVQWKLSVLVQWSNNSVIPGATVYAQNGSLVYSATTDSNGIARFNATHYVNNAGTITNYSSYTINTTVSGQNATNSTLVTSSKQVILNLTAPADSSPPAVTILNPQNITYATSSIQFNFTLNEAGVCNYSLNGGATNNTMTANASNTGFNATNASIADGGYTARAYCIDNAGNRNDSKSVVFSKDTTAPLVTIISPAARNYSTSSIEFNVSTNENSTCLYSLNSGLNNVTMTRNTTDTGFNATNSSIADGQYLANFYCNDTNGNWNRSESRAFGIDTIKPAINLTYPLNISYGYNVIQLNYTSFDANLQTCWWSSNNGVNNVTITCGTNITGANSSEGNNTWLVSVNDSVGNVNFSRVTFVKDTTASVITLISPPDGHNTTDTSMIFSYNITDTSNVTNCSLIVNNAIDQTNSSVAKNSQQNFSRAVSAAGYTWSVNCTDALNNLGNSTIRSLTINAQPPQQNTTTGGGSGGSSCLPKWQCSEWTECENGNQTRTCTDLKRCVFNAQIEKRACVVANKTNITTNAMEIERVGYCRENWTCQWEACRNGWQDAYNCTDINKCGTNAFEPVNRTCTEREFPLPDIPLVPVATVGSGIVIIGLFVWWWLLLLAAIPFFRLRLRHYCLSLIDFDNLLQLDTKINRGMFISLLRQHAKLVYAGARENTERFLFEKGFMELQFSRPCIVNAHFSALKEADIFKQSLIKAINEFSSSMGIDAAHRAELLRDITLIVERQSIFSALRAWRRQKRAERGIRGAVRA